ncbi:tetratricopeptide repeat protein [Collinsella aerofaciens]|uniref:Beta-barrel assembly-enhancing protease n=1 Tax=Collinsella aerofaciens TaxID=74426 RepID=A0A5K1J836_9ACTN|nr:tetratricopeptide repeat protein [Collinsella aerofaciens]VWL99866.1 Beta-barrel assembly-enhancing protease [Collinsella aerofaciens]
MISLAVATVLLLIHALVCLVLWTLMKLGLLPVRGHMLAVMVLVPLWGPLLVVLLSVRSAVFGDDLKDATLEALRINDDMHRSMLVQGREGDDGVVPLEEALIVNDPGDRRRLMLSMLTEDPDAYLAQLQAAKLNDDVEVAHYAATAVAQISKESDLKLQQLERAFKTDPSAQNLNVYCDYLGTYLASGLAEGRVAQIQRQQYARLLARRCEREDGLALRVRYATALADAGEVDEAEDVAERLVADAPDEQDVWMLCLRLAVLRRDGEMVRRVIDAVDKQYVYLSAENREKLAFWREGEEAR